ncbi:Heat shock transcription factor [Podospora pseudopauciseta]|uniref:Heat shock transcription factor n=1 Tax=Podospora pseudopauciseta TaxID=2093780 RepID=A0ABR0HHF6_9PEZI|nr:Heat shock transcription factor [Podospora pseudopauciseta]
MSSPNNPRKRPAPGASSMIPIPPVQQTFSPVQTDRLFGWNGTMDGNGFVDSPTTNVNQFMMPTSGAFAQPIAAPSNALARRGNSRALVHSGNRGHFDQVGEPWANGFAEDARYLQTNSSVDEHDNIELLEEKAAQAKREAQAKRKQIPPFVQKLSSFLDESRNTDLIRWSDKGDSFIVLDEDEFAKTLIPELFKHNNYASFVRQLNMYGFHKRVGLSDNSMKASERKNKSPSEYSNPYFRRGHPNLLWLINKPKGGSSKKKIKKEDGEAESEEDNNTEEAYGVPNHGASQGGRASVSHEVGPLQKKDLIQVKNQIDRIQQQQLAISGMLNKIRQDHNSLYQQAVMFQTMHERHENSINAILNFLANVFRKSLEEQGGVQSVQDLLASIIPNAQGHGSTNMATGGVVDLGGFVNQRAPNVAGSATPKRAQRLLPPVPHHQANKTVVTSLSPSPTPSPAPQTSYNTRMSGTVTEVFDTSPADTTSTSAYMQKELQNNPHEGMMKIIQDTNAVNVNSTGIDLPNVAATTPVTGMSNENRNKMLSIMNNGSAATTPAASMNGGGIPSVSSPGGVSLPAASPQTTAGLSLSPILASMPIPPPLQPLQATQQEIDALQRLQAQQASQLENLTQFLGPLSPSGRIPGMDENGNVNTSYFDSVDFDQFVDNNAFANQTGFGDNEFNGFNAGGHPDEFNFSLDAPGSGAEFGGGGVTGADNGMLGGGGGAGLGINGQDGLFDTGRVFETTSATNSPSPAGTEEITRSEIGGVGNGVVTDSPERDPKRRRRG